MLTLVGRHAAVSSHFCAHALSGPYTLTSLYTRTLPGFVHWCACSRACSTYMLVVVHSEALTHSHTRAYACAAGLTRLCRHSQALTRSYTPVQEGPSPLWSRDLHCPARTPAPNRLHTPVFHSLLPHVHPAARARSHTQLLLHPGLPLAACSHAHPGHSRGATHPTASLVVRPSHTPHTRSPASLAATHADISELTPSLL